MKEIPIHFWPLLVATIVRFVIGGLWYSPLLFGKVWAKLTGCSEAEMKKGMSKAMLIDLVGNFILAFVLIHAIIYAGANTFALGAAVGFFNWLGFIAMPTLGAFVWEHRPLKLYAIQMGFQLLSLLVIGGLLAAWY